MLNIGQFRFAPRFIPTVVTLLLLTLLLRLGFWQWGKGELKDAMVDRRGALENAAPVPIQDLTGAPGAARYTPV